MGFDQSSGAMGVGGGVRLGQRIRFMVRDREGAKSDLMEHALVLKRRQLQVSLELVPYTQYFALWTLSPKMFSAETL